jgi:phosphopantothenoylcysteine decarboxylase / phosphopantothenate---cysteine ligase
MLAGRNILLGITGSIAAYKTPDLVRQFIKQGANVKVILSESAKDFVSSISLATVSKNPVVTSYIKDKDTGEWENHVELAEWADLFIIAPATTNTIAKLAQGISDSVLLTTYQSARCPIIIAPAMDLEMYEHPSLKSNITELEKLDVHVLDSPSGDLASGLSGKGRMMEPIDIVKSVNNYISSKQNLYGKKIIITAGPTYEPIDPVRFIGNHSSGKMGLELAKAALQKGANVTLIIGPNSLNIPNSINLNVIRITTANEMDLAVKKEFHNADYAFFAAAVGDYRPKNVASQKIKKDKGGISSIELEENPDVLHNASKIKTPKQKVIGFALESENLIENAKRKIEKKKLDWIIANSLEDKGAGFKEDTNKVTLISNNFDIFEFELMTKSKLAQQLIDKITE